MNFFFSIIMQIIALWLLIFTTVMLLFAPVIFTFKTTRFISFGEPNLFYTKMFQQMPKSKAAFKPISFLESANFLRRMLDKNEGSRKDQFL